MRHASRIMLTTLTLLICLGAGLVAGVFFAFSAFVMRALANLPTVPGIQAMQQINVVVLNPLFLGAFVGTAVLAATGVVATFLSWDAGWAPPRPALFVAASVTYLLGCLGVTIAFNVPRNERLARLPAESPQAVAYWPVYVREWLFWNHVRTLAAIAAAAFAAGALAS